MSHHCYLELGLDAASDHPLKLVLHVLIHHLLYLLMVGQLFNFFRVLVQKLLVVIALRRNRCVLLLDLQVAAVETLMAYGVDDSLPFGLLVAWLGWGYLPSTELARLEVLELQSGSGGWAVAFWDLSFGEFMRVDDQLVAVLAQHVVFTLLTLPHGLLFRQSTTTVIAEEPVMVFLFLTHQPLHNPLPQFLSFLLRLRPNPLDLLLPLLRLRLPPLLPALRLLSQRVLDHSRVLGDLVPSWLFEPEVVLCLVAVHVHPSLFVFLVDGLLGGAGLGGILRTEPFLVEDVLLEEEISLVHVV